MTETSNMLTVKMASQRAGVSVSLIYQWCYERRLPHLRLGGKNKRGKILVLPADLDQFITSCRVTETDELDDDGELQFIR